MATKIINSKILILYFKISETETFKKNQVISLGEKNVRYTVYAPKGARVDDFHGQLDVIIRKVCSRLLSGSLLVQETQKIEICENLSQKNENILHIIV